MSQPACCFPHVESGTQLGLGVGVMLLEGLRTTVKRTTVSGMSTAPTSSLSGTAPIHLLQIPRAAQSWTWPLLCPCGDASRHTARMFSLLFCPFCTWKADVGPFKDRRTPWAHAHQQTPRRANTMLASLLFLHVSVWAILVCIYWVTTFSALLQIGRPWRGLSSPPSACRLQQGM